MKSHVADMEEQMNALTESVEKIHISSGLVDVHLGDRRQKLETLTGVSSLIHKVCLLYFYLIYFINNLLFKNKISDKKSPRNFLQNQNSHEYSCI